MEQYSIVRRPKLSRRAAHELILMFARWGNHYTTRESFETDASVKRAFAANGIAFDTLVDECRSPSRSVPFFENLIGSTWNVSSGASVSRVNMATGDESNKTQGPALYAPEGYWAMYEGAHEALDRATAKLNYVELLSAIVQGIASIDSFINARVVEWNAANPGTPLVDDRHSKVSFDDKIEKWIPIISGKRFDKGNNVWQHFSRLRGVRDNSAIHPKTPGHSIRYEEIVDLVNVFRTGIAGMLIQLHIHFAQRIPRVVIRDRYAPEAELRREEISSNNNAA